MSGGSWNYFYAQINEIGDRLIREDCQSIAQDHRVSLGKLIKLISEALYHIEWVDSYDLVKGQEIESIKAVFDYVKYQNPSSSREATNSTFRFSNPTTLFNTKELVCASLSDNDITLLFKNGSRAVTAHDTRESAENELDGIYEILSKASASMGGCG